jgi:hypothetical protein
MQKQDSYLTTREAAQYLLEQYAVTRSMTTIRFDCEYGRIDGVIKVTRDWIIPRVSLDKFIHNMPTMGRPLSFPGLE